MREATLFRPLTLAEIKLAKSVFENTVPYFAVLISDGLGLNDRPYTLPTFRINPSDVNLHAEGIKYVINAGDGYKGMDIEPAQRNTLIHELVHVWQGEHYNSWRWTYVLFSIKDQVLGDAYDYDKERYREWDNYGPEQQAQIVEDWFSDGMRTYDPDKKIGDIRYYFIENDIREKKLRYDWLIPPVTPLQKAVLNVPVFPSWETELLPLLEQKIESNNVAAIRARKQQLETYFSNIPDAETAKDLLRHLDSKQANSKLAQAFVRNLSTMEQQILLNILRSKIPKS